MAAQHRGALPDHHRIPHAVSESDQQHVQARVRVAMDAQVINDEYLGSKG